MTKQKFLHRLEFQNDFYCHFGPCPCPNMGKMLTFDRMVVESRNPIFLPKWPQLNSYKISSRASKFSLKCFLNRLIGQLVIM